MDTTTTSVASFSDVYGNRIENATIMGCQKVDDGDPETPMSYRVSYMIDGGDTLGTWIDESTYVQLCPHASRYLLELILDADAHQ